MVSSSEGVSSAGDSSSNVGVARANKSTGSDSGSPTVSSSCAGARGSSSTSSATTSSGSGSGVSTTGDSSSISSSTAGESGERRRSIRTAFVPSLATPRPSARATNSPFFILPMADFVGSFGMVLTGCALVSHARSSNFSSGSGAALSPSYTDAPPLHSLSKCPSHSSKSLTFTFSLGTKTCTL